MTIIMDAGKNWNVPLSVREDIPTEKIRAREWLADMMKGQPITKLDPVEPKEPAPWKPRERMAANDNEAIPICEALVRDRRIDDAALIRRYRHLFDVAGSPDTGGNAEVGTVGMNVAERTSITADGHLKSHGVRISMNAKVSSGTKTGVADEDTPRASNAPLRFNGGEDGLIAYMDAKPILGRLRAAMGPLVEMFEDAAISGRTLTEMGKARGFNGKQASAAAKSIVYMAIDALREEWAREQKIAETAAIHARSRVSVARDDMAMEQVHYFGKDITAKPGAIYGRLKAA